MFAMLASAQDFGAADIDTGSSNRGPCHCVIYLLELFGTADEADVRIEGAEHVFYAPAFDISPMPTFDLQQSCKGVPRVQASDVLIYPLPRSRTLETSELARGRSTPLMGWPDISNRAW